MAHKTEIKNQFELIVLDALRAVLDTLRPEAGHTDYWPSLEKTIRDAFNRILEDECNVAERFHYAFTLTLNISEARLGKESAWPIVRRNLLHILSPSRGAGFLIQKLVQGEAP